MRVAPILLLSLAACIGSTSGLEAVGDDADPLPGSPLAECNFDEECVPAGATCCDCPTFAIPIDDPTARACEAVDCDNDTSTCATNVVAACDQTQHACVLACAPLTCLECPNGYLTEANGCLSCTCAPPPTQTPSCLADQDCARTRADCCGCTQGGEDTAVATGDAAAFEQGLNCPSTPQCPGLANATDPVCFTDPMTGDFESEPRCVNGACALLDTGIPVDACGREDLLACAVGQSCKINVDPAASEFGLGVCRDD